MPLTTDRNDPNLRKVCADGQQESYLILSDVERSKGFVRPVRTDYIHTSCNSLTTMNRAIAETYAHNPKFYNMTFCCCCKAHFPVEEFIWTADGTVVGS